MLANQTASDAEGRAPAASELAQPERTEGTRGYVGECAAGVMEDETIIEVGRQERIGTTC